MIKQFSLPRAKIILITTTLLSTYTNNTFAMHRNNVRTLNDLDGSSPQITRKVVQEEEYTETPIYNTVDPSLEIKPGSSAKVGPFGVIYSSKTEPEVSITPAKKTFIANAINYKVKKTTYNHRSDDDIVNDPFPPSPPSNPKTYKNENSPRQSFPGKGERLGTSKDSLTKEDQDLQTAIELSKKQNIKKISTKEQKKDDDEDLYTQNILAALSIKESLERQEDQDLQAAIELSKKNYK